MPTLDVQVQRFSAVSSRPFDQVVSGLTASIGHPDMSIFHSEMTAARTIADLEKVVQAAVGSSGLMEFVRFDAGEMLRKEQGGQGPKILRLVVGSPIIMKDDTIKTSNDIDHDRRRLVETAAMGVGAAGALLPEYLAAAAEGNEIRRLTNG